MPVELEAVMMKAMAKSPDDRYATAEEFRADLLRFAEGAPVEAGDPALTSVMGAVGATGVVMAGQTQAVPAGGAGRAEAEHRAKKRTRRLIVVLVSCWWCWPSSLSSCCDPSASSAASQVAVPNVSGQTGAGGHHDPRRMPASWSSSTGPTELSSQAAGDCALHQASRRD